MRILVTGGAGFIGSQIVAALVSADHQVRVLDALIPGVHPPSSRPEFTGDVEFIHADVRDEERAPRRAGWYRPGLPSGGHGGPGQGNPRRAQLHGVQRSGHGGPGRRDDSGRARPADPGQLGSDLYRDSRTTARRTAGVRPPGRSVADLRSGRFEPKCPHCGAELLASAATEDDPLDPPRNVYAVSKLAQEHIVGAWARETNAERGGPALPQCLRPLYALQTARTRESRPHSDPGPPVARHRGCSRTAGRCGISCTSATSRRRTSRPLTGRSRDSARSTSPADSRDPSHSWRLPSPAPAVRPAPQITGEFRVGDVRHIFASPQRLSAELGWRPSGRLRDRGA